jgi:hypothetical protein
MSTQHTPLMILRSLLQISEMLFQSAGIFNLSPSSSTSRIQLNLFFAMQQLHEEQTILVLSGSI